MTKTPSPLASLILSDSAVADSMSETKRALTNAYDRIEDLQNALRELLWLCEHVAKHHLVSADVEETLTTDQRITDAQDLLR